jgi:hypothetical protein
MHSRSIAETKHIKINTPEIPWKPQCGENQQRRGFIGFRGMIKLQQKIHIFLQQKFANFPTVRPSQDEAVPLPLCKFGPAKVPFSQQQFFPLPQPSALTLQLNSMCVHTHPQPPFYHSNSLFLESSRSLQKFTLSELLISKSHFRNLSEIKPIKII